MDKETENRLVIYENRLHETIEEFAQWRGIEDLSKESQNVWNACLMYCKKHLFSNAELKAETGNKNYYDADKVNTICDLYIYYCLMYDKEVSIIGFSYLTGIIQENIYNWANRDIYNNTSNNCNTSELITYRDGTCCLPSYRHFEIYKKLSEGRESSLSAMLANGKRNPVGIIAILNHFYGWASPYTSDANRQSKQAIERQQAPEQLEQKEPLSLPKVD